MLLVQQGIIAGILIRFDSVKDELLKLIFFLRRNNIPNLGSSKEVEIDRGKVIVLDMKTEDGVFSSNEDKRSIDA